MESENDRWRELEGRLRAIEAVITEMPEFTDAVLSAAELALKARMKGRNPLLAEFMRLRPDEPLDEHAETALAKLAKQRGQGLTPAG